jgi:hypothetical protein
MVRIGRTRLSTSISVTHVAEVRPYRFVLMWTLAAGCAGCTSSSTPTLTSAPAEIETGASAESNSGQSSSGQSSSGHLSFERAIIVPGTPTDVYALVARGALGCWFASNGPLKATHVFRADAAPPSQGGQAEIVLYERDVSMRDQRGARAFQVKFASDAARVRVDMIVMRIGPPLAEPMLQDVEVWARGGAGCQTRAVSPPEAAAPQPPSAKTKTSRSGLR